MQPDFVVDLLDKFPHMLPQFGEAGITAGIDFFSLERLDEALALAVFPRTGRPAHTQVRTAGFQPLDVFVACILRTTIGVMHQTGLWMTAGNGLLLTPSIDHLFDRGFISFEDTGQTLISPVADPDSLRRMGVNVEAPPRVGGFNSDQRHFLQHHRSSIFLAAVSE